MIKYTVHKTKGSFTLKGTETSESIKITKDHPRFKWVGKQQGRIVTVTDTRWSSSKDYFGAYKVSVKPKAKGPIKLTKLDDITIDDSLFQPLPTDTIFDKFASTEGGFMPGSNVMAAGAPGVGKTTVLLELMSNLHESGKKALFISAEMNQIDMARYLKRFPHWGQLPILFLGDYTDECPKGVIEQVLNQGWDLVLTDSYTEVNDTVKEACGLTRSKTEKWFLDLMMSHNKGNNKSKIYTTFVTILQLSKGGTFVGSNKLKHMTTSMMELNWEGSENSGRRYMEFSKNRVGQVGKKLYFDFSNGVSFDEARYARDLFNDDIIQKEREALSQEGDAFDALFGLGQDAIQEPEAEAIEE